MNSIKKLNVTVWLYAVIISSLLICFSIYWIYKQQNSRIKHEIIVLDHIRQARIDFTKGFLHVGLAGNVDSPFREEIGIAYINQAALTFKNTLTLPESPHHYDASSQEDELLRSFLTNISQFQLQVKSADISNAKTATNLRIQFFSLEQQADQIDTLINLRLNKLAAKQNTEFLTALLIAAILLALICVIFFYLILKINKSRKKFTESQNHLQSISDNLGTGMIYQLSTAGENMQHYTYLSNGVKQLYGCTPEAAMSNPMLIYSNVHPDDNEALRIAKKEAYEHKAVFKKELRVFNPDGSMRWSYCVAHPRMIEDNLCWDGIELDITEQKEMEIALLKSKLLIEQSEEKFRIATEATKDGIYEWNITTNETVFSKRYYEILGFEADYDTVQLTYNDWENRIHPEDKNQVMQTVTEAIETGHNFNIEYRHLHKSNAYRWQNSIGKVIVDEDGNSPRMIGCIRDIHTNKVAETALEDERNFLKSILESMSDAFISLDEQGIITYVNAKAVEILGQSYEDLLGEPISTVFTERMGHPLPLSFEEIVNEKKSIQLEKQYEAFNLWIQYSIFPTNTGVAIFFSDITHRKNIELELFKAKEKAEESDRLKTAFLANMSHEIRTPMNGILGFSSLLSEPGLGQEEQQEYIKLIQVSGARMLNLISEIIDISKIESGMMEISLQKVNINEKIAFVYNLLKLDAEERSLTLSHNTAAFHDLYLITDPEKCYAILTNLVKNAIKYTDQGSIEFGYTINDKNIEFFVKDTGIGIPKERQAAIFERFIQVDIANIQARQGAGLGLAIAKAFVNLLGGRIWLESEEGKGTTFYFTLPYNAKSTENKTEEVAAQKEEHALASAFTSKLKILIADDDAISRKLIVKSVADIGNEIIQAKSGREAVEKFMEHRDVDLILMDVQMPDMNGYEATMEIRKTDPNVIIITQSAFGLTGDREKAIEAGSNDYITKPIDKSELMLLINKYFKQLPS
ncbi:PAS domain-containing protein [Flavobacterium sp. SM2513]|uniref:PAS domain-containing protein n=1 Tax=Flavobacterium sp. SM2513 TaxID=3424766 RepID=UPI003D7F469F